MRICTLSHFLAARSDVHVLVFRACEPCKIGSAKSDLRSALRENLNANGSSASSGFQGFGSEDLKKTTNGTGSYGGVSARQAGGAYNNGRSRNGGKKDEDSWGWPSE